MGTFTGSVLLRFAEEYSSNQCLTSINRDGLPVDIPGSLATQLDDESTDILFTFANPALGYRCLEHLCLFGVVFHPPDQAW